MSTSFNGSPRNLISFSTDRTDDGRIAVAAAAQCALVQRNRPSFLLVQQYRGHTSHLSRCSKSGRMGAFAADYWWFRPRNTRTKRKRKLGRAKTAIRSQKAPLQTGYNNPTALCTDTQHTHTHTHTRATKARVRNHVQRVSSQEQKTDYTAKN